MRYSLRLLSRPEGINEAVTYINSSDYFRSVEQDEVDQSAFVRIGDAAGYMWFRWVDDLVIAGHIIIKPQHRKYAVTRHVINGASYMAEFMGAYRLYALKPPEKIKNYLHRLGWFVDEFGMYKEIR